MAFEAQNAGERNHNGQAASESQRHVESNQQQYIQSMEARVALLEQSLSRSMSRSDSQYQYYPHQYSQYPHQPHQLPNPYQPQFYPQQQSHYPPQSAFQLYRPYNSPPTPRPAIPASAAPPLPPPPIPPINPFRHSRFSQVSPIQPTTQHKHRDMLTDYDEGNGDPYIDLASPKSENFERRASETDVGHGPDAERPSVITITEKTNVNGTHNLANGDVKIADTSRNTAGTNGEKSQVETHEESQGKEIKPLKTDSHDEQSTHKPDSGTAEIGNDNAKSEKPAATQSKNNRIRTVVRRWNGDKSKWEDVEDKFETGKDASDKAATFRRRMDSDNEKKVDFEEVEIHSQNLKNLLADTDERWRDLVTESSQPVTVDTPFYHFVWGWDKYVKACEPEENDTPELKETRNDLKDLVELIRSSNSLESYFRSRDTMRSSKKIKFDYLWTLFSHGAKVYARSYMNELQMFEVKDCSAPPYGGRRFRVTCSAFDWDGSQFSTYCYDFYIKEFSGEKSISSLEVFPTEYFCNSDGDYDDSKLRQQLLERGRKYCNLCTEEPTNFQCEYQGTAIVSPSGLHRMTSKGRPEDLLSSDSDHRYYEELNVTSIDITGKQSRVIIDNYAFLKSERNTMKIDDMPPLGKKVPFFEPDCVCSTCKSSPLEQWKPDSRPQPSVSMRGKAFSEGETRLLFLPPRLLGFGLKDKVWGQFLVDRLTRASFAKDQEQTEPFWDELQLEEESKELLMAYVDNHEAPSLRQSRQEAGGMDAKAFDVIEGKGQGLVVLLHGPPGVGKTLTAETIALATARPLLTVSVAEIGVEAHEAERKLTDVFVDAARWEAVLLMDEADVFVEERMKGDLSRNALVSVLLRCLEYYDGIIILTTNRVRSIDAAVQSRIHLAIQYHDLSAQQRLAIYKNRLKWIPDEEMEDRKALVKGLENSPLTKKSNKANGRQIRNIVAGARALAKRKNQRLTLDHLVAVDETTSSFINSMADLMQKQRVRNELDYEQ